jgi:hypothetical protein
VRNRTLATHDEQSRRPQDEPNRCQGAHDSVRDRPRPGSTAPTFNRFLLDPEGLRQCSEHQKLTNEEINAWEAYDGLKESLANDPVPSELAEELDRRYKMANEASEVKYHVVWCPLCRE